MMKRHKQILSWIIVWLLHSAVNAATISSAGSGLWSNPATWSGGVVPTAADDVVIQNGHTITLDVAYSGSTVVICRNLTVQITGVLRLGYDGANLSKQFGLTGNLVCEGTISAGRNVPADGNSGEGLIFANNSSLVMILNNATSTISGRGYLHPQDLIITNTSSSRELIIDHENVLLDGNFKVLGTAPTNVVIEKYTYLNVAGTLGITGGTFAETPNNTQTSLNIKGIVYTNDVSLFTKNVSVRSSITLQSEGVLSANKLNNGATVTSAAGGFLLALNTSSIFRCGKGVASPVQLTSADPNFTVSNSGTIKLHYSQTLSTGTQVINAINTFDKNDFQQVAPLRDKVGATHIAGWYNFTAKPFLLEGKERFKDWGSRNIKTTISADNGRMYNAYPFNHTWPDFNQPVDVIKHQFVDSLFSDPYFKTHAFWAPSKNVNGFYKDGADRNHNRYIDVENQMYLAAREILLKYGNMGKKFIFQNWEGDWMLRGEGTQWEADPGSIPDDVQWQVEGMARMWRAYMRGIERAAAEFPQATSKIQYAVEFNKLYYLANGVRRTMMDLNIPSVIADVLPKVRMHLASWSSYDGIFDEPTTRPFPTGLWNGMEMASYYINDTKNIGGIPVQIGEFGINENPPYQGLSNDVIVDRYNKLVAMVSKLGVQNVYLWNFYGSGQQNVQLEKGVKYDASYLYQVLDGKWVVEPDNTFGLAAKHLRDNYFISGNQAPSVVKPIEDLFLTKGFGSTAVNIATVFSDINGDKLTYTIKVENESVVTGALSGTTLTLTEKGNGSTRVTITANDGQANGKTDFSFSVTVTERAVFIGTQNYPTIKDALAAATEGAIINIRGVHIEPLTISKNITLRGADPRLDKILASSTMQTATTSVVYIARSLGVTTDLNVTIENLGIRNGKSIENGGGIFADKLQGLLTLKNLIIENNSTDRNGGGICVSGTNADIIDCVIQNNIALLDGGAAILVPNNSVTADSKIKIIRSLMDHNEARNGGGLYINGNKDFGNNRFIDVYIENSTLSNNIANSTSTAVGGGAIWSKCAFWTGNNTTNNVTLTMVHATLFNNTHSAAAKNGIVFTSESVGAVTNFSIYNSIVVTGDDIAQQALNFNNAKTLDIVNCIFGGVNTSPALADDPIKNITKGLTATQIGIAKSLTMEGGLVPIFTLASSAKAVNYCTASVSISLPNKDGRSYARDATPDAGAFEFVSNTPPTVANPIADQKLNKGFKQTTLDLSKTFSDANGDNLALSVSVENLNVVSATISGLTLSLTEVGSGATKIVVTANDGKGGTVTDDFILTVNSPPVVANSIADRSLTAGFLVTTISTNNIFLDPDADVLTLSVAVANESVVKASISGTTLIVIEAGSGETMITLTANDGKGGSVTTTFKVSVQLVMSLKDEQLNAALYPNPAREKFSVNLGDQKGTLSILSLSGSAIYRGAYAQSSDYDVSQFPSGVYIVLVEQEDGSKSYFKLFIHR